MINEELTDQDMAVYNFELSSNQKRFTVEIDSTVKMDMEEAFLALLVFAHDELEKLSRMS